LAGDQVAMIYVYRIIRKKPVENVKIAGMFPGKKVFDYSKSEAILTSEYLTKRKENCSSHYWFQFVLISISIQKKREKRGNKTSILLKKY